MKKPITEIDAHIGRRIKARRLHQGMSQENLADALGITFQQVQKYEKGTNGARGSRIVGIAKALNVSPGYFFEGIVEAPGQHPQSDPTTQFMVLPYAAELATAYGLMTNEQRRALADIANVIAPAARTQAKAA